ncbi:putative multidrug resistance ABC transporter ATP-binding/permease protein YheH [Phaeobacter sp. CECT 5382]|uniref:ABC transporter transmembrane domain-containing protein n=1 Tax=Phaeobacter sp. CECT 5382 TaxID=1712645 RepID=UPI0006D964DA|nr:ABC transporter transmembrane domain-containing protein [Phaeobacter sp. CECT 5382]CUH86999.1 putative multidrug resistance ABC transporter ATP-binding/permease protein YheH [Phaeobacter sp. CECT 5382]
MPPTLFSFIWRYSKRQQLGLLALTLLTFPFLYASLELPKRIINDAIGAAEPQVVVLGTEMSQVDYLLVLCFAFLAAVVLAGLLKMRLNTAKGVVAERLLRRLRYSLINRMIRFPKPYFRTTSQGELVSMITSESEPMGGLMGDALAQPVFQAGQMLTIVAFLFAQSVWFGLVSIALIPLQAWLIPMLQRQINLLNKDRIQEVRALAAEIGETAAGISDLRGNGGWRYRLAQISDRLGRLFEIRRRIYNKKYFMKFLNNLIGHMTPFVYYSAGGVLAIRGEITVGALVAGLAAYKDLSAPWKELLTYYNQVQDMGLRWKVMTSRFAPKGMIDANLLDGAPTTLPHLRGDLVFRNVSLRDADGNMILEDLSLTIPARARVAVKSSNDAERAALGQLLTREVLPSRGSITLAGHRLEALHQGVLAARVGYASAQPYLFSGSLGDNILMPLRSTPSLADPSDDALRQMDEARRTGNSPDLLTADWVNPALAGLGSEGDLRDWWFQLVEAMGVDEQIFQRTLRAKLPEGNHQALKDHIIRLRPLIRKRLRRAGLDGVVYHFEPEVFNPAMPLAGNILFASPAREILPEELMLPGSLFHQVIREQHLSAETLGIGLGVAETLIKTFGREDFDHPLFQRLGIDEDLYCRLCKAAELYSEKGEAELPDEARAVLMTVPFLLSAEQIGPGFPEDFKRRILRIRAASAATLTARSEGLFRPLTPEGFFPRLSVLENALYGKISTRAGEKGNQVEALVAEVLAAYGLKKRLALILYDLPTGLGGALLDPLFRERAAFTRAAIKRPDVLILDRALASHDSESRLRTRDRLRDLMPTTTMIFMEEEFAHPERYDLFVEIRDGRIDGVDRRSSGSPEDLAAEDFRQKFEEIARAELFARLDARNQRLLAFSAQWHPVAQGDLVFARGEMGDAVYLCLKGRAELFWSGVAPGEQPISVVEPGRLIGDLAVILRQPRELDLRAAEDCLFLRIGAEEYRAVIESDAGVAMQLLETVAGHLVSLSGSMRDSVHDAAPDPLSDFEPASAGEAGLPEGATFDEVAGNTQQKADPKHDAKNGR